MKKLLMLVIIWLTSPICYAKDKCKAIPDGNGGVVWKYYHNGKLTDTEYLDKNMWATLQRHWKTGEPLEDCQATIAAQARAGEEQKNNLWRQAQDRAKSREEAEALWRQKIQAETQRQEAEQTKNQEQAFLSDAAYGALWNELYEYESQEYYRYGNRGSKSKWHHAYGDTWLSLSRASRTLWYDYLFPKISFGEISEWSEKAHVKAEEERQEYMREMDAAGRDGGGGSSSSGGDL
jgi:hypothetical protein